MTGYPQPPGAGAQKTAEVTSAVRGLCTVLNTALVYQTSHPVFQRAVEQEFGLLETALKGVPDITLFFASGEIRYGTLAIDPGSAALRKLAQSFEARGIKGLAFHPGITADEISKFVTVVTARSNEIETQGLARGLENAGVRHIREHKVKIGIVGKDAVVRPEEEKKPPAAAPAAAPARPARPAVAWDIEAGTDVINLDNPLPDIAPTAPAKDAPRVFRKFVHNVLGSVERRETTAAQAGELIAQEFEAKLNEKVEEVRREGEVKVRRLERVKEVMLRELENLHLAAVVLDAELQVVGLNDPARRLLGNLQSLEPGHPLRAFVESRKERQTIHIAGVTRLAHTIISTSEDREDSTMLICLE